MRLQFTHTGVSPIQVSFRYDVEQYGEELDKLALTCWWQL